MVNSDVTVIIPVRNGANFIVESLISVYNQTIVPSQVIVIDDGSTDGTRELVHNEFGNQVLLLAGPKKGAGPARNMGVDFSTSTYLAFLDADDVWHESKLESQLQEIIPGTIQGTYADYFVQRGNRKTFFGNSVRTSNDQEANELINGGLGLPCLLSSWILERKTFLDLGGFDDRFIFSQDFEFALRAARRGIQFKVIRESLLDYRVHHNSETITNYVGQRLFAEYSRYTLVENGDLPVDEWKSKKWSNKHKRQAIAGFYFRMGLSRLGQPLPISSAFLFFISLALDPIRFMNKVRTQSNFRLLARRR